ncbi:MAG: protein arginine kinase [Zavarzinella sp.]
MILNELPSRLGEWLRGTGADADVVISTRIRLARNIAGLPFITRLNTTQKAEVETRITNLIANLGSDFPLHYVPVHLLDELDRQLLVERQLISRELANVIEGPRGVAFDDRESISLMINEEDQLRIQSIRSGFDLETAWNQIDRLDDEIESRIEYAFSEEFGYLTACPTNVGTGMRASVMLHLPALTMTKQIEMAFKALQRINLVVRGLYGEGSHALGDLFQISNQVTLGVSELACLNDIRTVIFEVIKYERMARNTLVREARQMLIDKIARALGTLQSATMMESQETLELLSAVRLGVQLQLISDFSVGNINLIFQQTQSAHLQKLRGSLLEGEARNFERATFVRKKLKDVRITAS